MGEARRRGSKKERAADPKGRMLTGRFKRKREAVTPGDKIIFEGRTYYKDSRGRILNLTLEREKKIMMDLYSAEQRTIKRLEDEYRRKKED